MLTDCKKSKVEIHFVKPQILHSNKIPTSRDFTRSKGLSYLQKFIFYVPAKLTTLDVPIPYKTSLIRSFLYSGFVASSTIFLYCFSFSLIQQKATKNPLF